MILLRLKKYKIARCFSLDRIDFKLYLDVIDYLDINSSSSRLLKLTEKYTDNMILSLTHAL